MAAPSDTAIRAAAVARRKLLRMPRVAIWSVNSAALKCASVRLASVGGSIQFLLKALVTNTPIGAIALKNTTVPQKASSAQRQPPSSVRWVRTPRPPTVM